MPGTDRKMFLTVDMLTPVGVASMMTDSVFLRMETVVANTRTEKMKVQMGSTMTQVGWK